MLVPSDALSKADISSSLSAQPTAPRLLSSCSTPSHPNIATVTSRLLITQFSAVCATVLPRSAAMRDSSA